MSKKIFLLIFLFLFGGGLGWYLFGQTNIFVVKEVIDGDTIVLSDGRKVRYLIVDTPEEGECYAQQAADVNRELVAGKKVKIETDVNQMDQFGRILAYVYLQQGGQEVMVNEYLLREGAGTFFLDTVNLRQQEKLVQAAEDAHEKKRGLWSFCAPDKELGCQIKGNLDKDDVRWYHLPQHQKAPDFSRGMNGLLGLSVRGFASRPREKPRALARGGSQSDSGQSGEW